MAGRVIDRGDIGSHEPGASNGEGVKVAFGAGWALQSPWSQKVIMMGCISHMWELDQRLNGGSPLLHPGARPDSSHLPLGLHALARAFLSGGFARDRVFFSISTPTPNPQPPSVYLRVPPTAVGYLQPPSVTSNRRQLPPTAVGYLQPPSVTSNRQRLPPTAVGYPQPPSGASNSRRLPPTAVSFRQPASVASRLPSVGWTGYFFHPKNPLFSAQTMAKSTLGCTVCTTMVRRGRPI